MRIFEKIVVKLRELRTIFGKSSRRGCYLETPQSLTVVVSPLCSRAVPPLSCSRVAVNVEGVNPHSHFRLCHAATLKSSNLVVSNYCKNFVNLLGKDARIQVNQLVHYVFNHALVGGNLADRITFENVVLLWFMLVNILLTFIIGYALGWILIKLTKAPKHLEGLIMGVCFVGNLGNLPIIIIPAICKDKGSPFGDSNVCCQYGMAYASLSMVVGAVYIWTYVYNIMRVSTSVVPKDDYRTNSFRLEASEEFLEFLPEEESSEPENPPKDNMMYYTLLLSSIESEENVKLPISAKIKHQIGKLLVNSNFRAIFSPATLGAIVGFIVGVVPQIRKLMIGGDASLHVIQDSVTMVGYVCIPKLIFNLKLH
ncbi:protein PIN-LIKES 3-like [Glycine max]|uniref:protein PIN-LIKES 3-like n=1 Tax=Glycine max TaxID=3847 RepID=UPI0007193068|nr:protein PIN-LIKES 3-like [Glycine max]|eukprot:XP_014617064.1 protein PIN-LIKES 3-like [Glycine max]